MIERLSFAFVFAAASVFSSLWTFAPISRLLSKVLGSRDNGLTYDYIFEFFVQETVPRAIFVTSVITLVVYVRESKPTIAWLGALFVFPVTLFFDFVLQVAQ